MLRLLGIPGDGRVSSKNQGVLGGEKEKTTSMMRRRQWHRGHLNQLTQAELSVRPSGGVSWVWVPRWRPSLLEMEKGEGLMFRDSLRGGWLTGLQWMDLVEPRREAAWSSWGISGAKGLASLSLRSSWRLRCSHWVLGDVSTFSAPSGPRSVLATTEERGWHALTGVTQEGR